MALILELKRATYYIRTSSHTCIRDDDPELNQLLSFGRWDQHTHVHIWLTESDPHDAESHHINAYLGSVPIWNRIDIDRSKVRRVVQTRLTAAPKDQHRLLCRQLRSALREYPVRLCQFRLTRHSLFNQ